MQKADDGLTKQINLRLTPHDLAVLDRLRKEAVGFPSRSDVMRNLIRDRDAKHVRGKLSD